MSPDGDQCQTLLSEAFDLAVKAIECDNSGKYAGAIDRYDKTIIALDELLNFVPIDTEVWRQILHLRKGYDMRMETLRSFESKRSHSSSIFSEAASYFPSLSTSTTVTASTKASVALEVTEHNVILEPIPSLIILMPFWQLRAVRRSIVEGAFMNKRLFIPSTVWQQVGVRMSGITVKTAIFRSMASSIEEHLLQLRQVCQTSTPRNNKTVADTQKIESSANFAESSYAIHLQPSNVPLENVSVDAVHNVYYALCSVYAEFCQCQNQMAKSFSYVPETEDPTARARTSSAAASDSGKDKDGSGGRKSYTEMGSSNLQTGPSDSYTGPSNSKDTSILARGMGALGRAGILMSSGASNLSKNVRKMAEAGISRLGAMYTRTTQEEMIAYIWAIHSLVERCELIQYWYQHLETMRGLLLVLTAETQSATASDQHRLQSHNQVIAVSESALATLLAIMQCIRVAACEVLLRDLAELHSAYLQSSMQSLVDL